MTPPPTRRSVFPILGALATRYRMVLGVPFLAAVITSIIVLMMPPTYGASASFVPERTGATRLPSGLAGVAAQFGFNLGADASRSPAFYASLIRSREVLAAVLQAKIRNPEAGPPDSITVYELYRVRGDTPELRREDGLKGLRNRIRVGVDQRTDVVHVTVEAPAATAARDVVQLLLTRMAEFNVNTRQSSARERRTFVEGRVQATERDLRGAEEALRSFYDRNRQWRTSPQLQFEEQRLNRQVNVQQELYLTLRREYETARIEEINNTPVLTVLDQPDVPGRRVRPRRTITVIVVSFVAGILAVTGAILLQSHEDLLATGDPEYARLRRRVREVLGRSTPPNR